MYGLGFGGGLGFRVPYSTKTYDLLWRVVQSRPGFDYIYMYIINVYIYIYFFFFFSGGAGWVGGPIS